MRNQKNDNNILNECVLYFKQNAVWKRLFLGFEKKYYSYGKFSGRITLKNLSCSEIEELEGFFAESFHGKKSVTISSEKFEKALKNSKYSLVTPEEILTAFFGKTLLGKTEEVKQKEQKKKLIEEDFLAQFAKTPAVKCFALFNAILKSYEKNNLQQWNRLLWLCAKVYNALPYRKNQKIYLPVFAAEISGNPHAFDMGTTEGNILYQVLLISLEQRGLVVESSDLFPAYKRQKSYLLAGILIDDISNYAILYQVRAMKKDRSEHQGMLGFFSEKNMVQVPLNIISEWESIECIDNEIYVVENPSVFAAICKEKSCMCMNGQPRLASILVLDLLAKSNVKIYYSGDLDPEGLLIAQKLRQYYRGNFVYWHMKLEDYRKGISQEYISDKRKKILERIKDEELLPVANLMKEYGVASYQENILDKFKEVGR